MISYKVSPFLNIPLNWVTEITDVREPFYFADEQRKGPYKTWRHEHNFQEVPEGVLMTDVLKYEVGKGIFGWVAEKIYVEKKVKDIFKYRSAKLEKLFLRSGAGKKQE